MSPTAGVAKSKFVRGFSKNLPKDNVHGGGAVLKSERKRGKKDYPASGIFQSASIKKPEKKKMYVFQFFVKFFYQFSPFFFKKWMGS